jgi:hypothetical protein
LAFALHFQGLIFPLYVFIISSPSHNFALFKFASQSFPRKNCNCCMDFTCIECLCCIMWSWNLLSFLLSKSIVGL